MLSISQTSLGARSRARNYDQRSRAYDTKLLFYKTTLGRDNDVKVVKVVEAHHQIKDHFLFYTPMNDNVTLFVPKIIYDDGTFDTKLIIYDDGTFDTKLLFYQTTLGQGNVVADNDVTVVKVVKVHPKKCNQKSLAHDTKLLIYQITLGQGNVVTKMPPNNPGVVGTQLCTSIIDFPP